MTDRKQTILERNINPYHSFLSSFFAGLADLGLVNQGSMNIVSRRAAEYMYSYLEAKGIAPDMEKVPGQNRLEVAKNLILFTNKLLNLVGEYDLKMVDDNRAALLISAKQCRICPKGVGGAEVTGTLCPIPSFLEALINHMAGEKYLILDSTGIEKQGENCIAYYQLVQD